MRRTLGVYEELLARRRLRVTARWRREGEPLRQSRCLKSAAKASLDCACLLGRCPAFQTRLQTARSPMPAITLPDGSVRRFDRPVSGRGDRGRHRPAIGQGRARRRSSTGSQRPRSSARSRRPDRDRHPRASRTRWSCCATTPPMCMAEAVQELYPGTQVTFGPATETGFYYDFARDQPFTPEDLAKIEERMHEIVRRDEAIAREVWDRDDAIRFFADKGETYKAEHDRDAAGRRGDHRLPPGRFRRSLHRPASALDRQARPGLQADEDRRRLLAGRSRRTPSSSASTAPPGATRSELEAYLHQLEEAEQRDHRRLGREMDLFHQQEEAVGPGVLAPEGLDPLADAGNYVRRRLDADGYLEVKYAAACGPQRCGRPRAIGRSSASTCSRPNRRGQGAGLEADELPRPCPDLPAGAEELSRPAAAAGGVRLLPPQRAVRARCTG